MAQCTYDSSCPEKVKYYRPGDVYCNFSCHLCDEHYEILVEDTAANRLHSFINFMVLMQEREEDAARW